MQPPIADCFVFSFLTSGDVCFDEIHEIWMFVLLPETICGQCLFAIFFCLDERAKLDSVFRCSLLMYTEKTEKTQACADHANIEQYASMNIKPFEPKSKNQHQICVYLSSRFQFGHFFVC